jgi:hypothetical protein
MDKLKDLAKVIRSKNAGALLLTLDVMFEDQAVYERVRNSNVLNVRAIAQLYGVSDNQIEIVPFDVAHAIKITLPRAVPAGSPGDTDVYGAQQHAPLLEVQVPLAYESANSASVLKAAQRD